MHLDKDQDRNQRVVRDTDVSEIQQMSSMTQNQIHSLENEDVFGSTNQIGWSLILSQFCTLVHDTVVKQLKAKMCAISNSMLCLGGKCPEYPRSSKGWAERFEYFVSTHQYRELDNIDGELVVFEWEISSGAQHWIYSKESKN